MATALIVGDVEVGILDTFSWAQRILTPLQAVLRHARASNVPVIYVRAALRSTEADIVARNPIASWMFGLGDLFDESSPSTDVHPDVAPLDGEPSVIKRRVSAFAGTDLDSMLRARGVTSIVLTGVATTGVVLATLLAAADLDYGVTVLSDCCADQADDVQAMMMTTVFPGRGARVLTSAEWIADAGPAHG